MIVYCHEVVLDALLFIHRVLSMHYGITLLINALLNSFYGERSGFVVECLTRD